MAESLKLKKWQRVFVNRSLNMGSIKAIGFDMDHTLVRYNREAFEALAFRETLKKFISAGYPEELARLTFDPTYVIRGLLVDMERGNLLKVDGHKYVKLAFHGKRALDKEERHKLYNAESYKVSDLLSVDTFFALSEVQLFTEIVEYMRNNPGKIQKTYREIYADLRLFIDLSHRDGTIKNEVLSNMNLYLLKDKHLAQSLIDFLDGGKQLFLLTNSAWDYTDQVMRYTLMGEHEDFSSWRDYFSAIIVGSGKPGFFMGSQPFYEVMTDTGYLKIHDGPLGQGKIFHGGNAHLFQKLTKLKGDEILYLGDHIYGDIIRSKGLFNWRTALVVEELDQELPKLEDLKNDLAHITDESMKRELIDEELSRVQSLLRATMRQEKLAQKNQDEKKQLNLQKNKEKLQQKVSDLEAQLRDQTMLIKQLIRDRESKVHPIWGELMHVGLEKSRFAKQVEEYACLYTSCISNLRFYSQQKKFVSPHDTMPHDF